jgi:hypothetical protein
MIRKVAGGKYKVVSESGKNLSKPTSHEQAVKRLAQVHYFKNQSKKK